MPEYGSWAGYKMRSPEGKVGTVYKDNNWGMGRTLYVRFDDDETTTLELNNVGPNSARAQEWEWWYEGHAPSFGEDVGHWVKWGK